MKTIILAALALAIGAGNATAQGVSCSTFGNQTMCSDGTTAARYGNTTYINPPAPTYQHQDNSYQPTRVCTHYAHTTYCN